MGEKFFYYEALNLVTICADSKKNEDYSGRLYHCCSEKPIRFENTLQMIKRMEELYDMLNNPQASTQARCFTEKKKKVRREAAEVTDKRKNWGQKGMLGTFVVRVQYRQNATWQGQVTWAEGQETRAFRSALELLKLIDNALDVEDNTEQREDDSCGHIPEAEIQRQCADENPNSEERLLTEKEE